MGEHAVCLTAEQQATDAATTVRGHHDEVASTCPSYIDDRLEDIVAALAQRLAGNPALGSCLGSQASSASRSLFRSASVFMMNLPFAGLHENAALGPVLLVNAQASGESQTTLGSALRIALDQRHC